MTNKEFFDLLAKKRHIDRPCLKCSGLGTRAYSSGSTWRGGMGTASIKYDICDQCWGSGDETHSWLNLRTLESDNQKLIEARAATHLEHTLGLKFSMLRPAINLLIEQLEKLSRSRKLAVVYGFDTMCLALSKFLRSFVKGN